MLYMNIFIHRIERTQIESGTKTEDPCTVIGYLPNPRMCSSFLATQMASQRGQTCAYILSVSCQ